MARAMSSLPVPVAPRMEHGGGSGRDASNLFVDGLHRAAAADDGRPVGGGFADYDRLRHEAAAGDGRGDHVEQFVGFEGFEQVIARAQLGGFDGRLGGAVRGHQDDRLFGFGRVKLRDEFQAAQPRHSQIGADDVKGLLARLLQAGVAAPGDGRIVTFGAQHFLQRRGGARIVFNQEDFRFHVPGLAEGSRGRLCRAEAPFRSGVRRRVFRRSAPRWGDPARCRLPSW